MPLGSVIPEVENEVDLSKFKVTPKLRELLEAGDQVTIKRNELNEARCKFITLLKEFERQ